MIDSITNFDSQTTATGLKVVRPAGGVSAYALNNTRSCKRVKTPSLLTDRSMQPCSHVKIDRWHLSEFAAPRVMEWRARIFNNMPSGICSDFQDKASCTPLISDFSPSPAVPGQASGRCLGLLVTSVQNTRNSGRQLQLSRRVISLLRRLMQSSGYVKAMQDRPALTGGASLLTRCAVLIFNAQPFSNFSHFQPASHTLTHNTCAQWTARTIYH